MANRGLLFIPDISGFSKFVHETEIEHSRLIIQELLEILINSNNTGLEISEIEGDAILFYKFGEPPSMNALYSQVEKMFREFHRSLFAYDYRKYCQCKACVSVLQLTLKIITHYGEFAGYRVKDFNKLIGKDLIVAHQLLKNDIPEHEYWLVTDQILGTEKPSSFGKGMEWNASAKKTEMGDIQFHYAQLGSLKNSLEPERQPTLDLENKQKVISLTADYETDIITMFHAAGGFQYRSKWFEGVKNVEEFTHFLPRLGMKCKCILDSGEVMIFSTSYRYSSDKIEFSETDEKQNVTYVTLEKKGPLKTSLRLDYYIKKNIGNQILFSVQKKAKLESRLKRSLENLQLFSKELVVAVPDLPYQPWTSP